MNFDFVTNATAKELEQFKSVCNQLLSRTYIVRTIYQLGKGRVDNPDYLFLSRHYEAVQEYLSLLDWDLRRDELNGYFYVLNTDEANRCNLNKKETAILLALRLIYEENMERLGLEQDAMCTVRDVLEKVVTDYPVFPAKPNMEEVKRAFTVLENHSVIQRLEGKFNQSSCRIAILLYGDNVIEKHGINRDRTGDREKTRYLCGKQGIFTRDRPLIRPGFIRQLETRASTRSSSFFRALGGPTTAAALLGHIVPTTGRNP